MVIVETLKRHQNLNAQYEQRKLFLLVCSCSSRLVFSRSPKYQKNIKIRELCHKKTKSYDTVLADMQSKLSGCKLGDPHAVDRSSWIDESAYRTVWSLLDHVTSLWSLPGDALSSTVNRRVAYTDRFASWWIWQASGYSPPRQSRDVVDAVALRDWSILFSRETKHFVQAPPTLRKPMHFAAAKKRPHAGMCSPRTQFNSNSHVIAYWKTEMNLIVSYGHLTWSKTLKKLKECKDDTRKGSVDFQSINQSINQSISFICSKCPDIHI